MKYKSTVICNKHLKHILYSNSSFPGLIGFSFIPYIFSAYPLNLNNFLFKSHSKHKNVTKNFLTQYKVIKSVIEDAYGDRHESTTKDSGSSSGIILIQIYIVYE